MLSMIFKWTDRDRYNGIREGSFIPRWQGIVMHDPATRTVLVAPIPLNLALAWGWKIWMRLKRGWRKQELLDAYELGRMDEKQGRIRRELLQEMEQIIRERRQ